KVLPSSCSRSVSVACALPTTYPEERSEIIKLYCAQSDVCDADNPPSKLICTAGPGWTPYDPDPIVNGKGNDCVPASCTVPGVSPIPPTREKPPAPVLQFVNVLPSGENPVISKISNFGQSNCWDLEEYWAGQIKNIISNGPISVNHEDSEYWSRQIASPDSVDKITSYTLKVRFKQSLSGSCDTCTEHDPSTCCISDWAEISQDCLGCNPPGDIQVNINNENDRLVFVWQDNSNIESGFVVYACAKNLDPSKCILSNDKSWTISSRQGVTITSYATEVLNLDSEIYPTVQSYVDSHRFVISCFTTCTGGDPSPIPPTSSPASTSTPRPTATSTPRPTNTPMPLSPTSTPVPGQPTSTPAPTNTSVPLPTLTPVPTSISLGGYLEPTAPPESKPTRIVLPQAGVDFPLKGLGLVGIIVTLLGFFIIL
ncbi:hypothetical protein KJ909_03120, partial [Patescibacteria group bacterium]|nr:hypothetical protein [Patescibacteria group bacterium]